MERLLNASAPGADWVKDGTIDSFYDDVMTASNKVPVIVDFWATWCGPCKTLGPTLERVVKAAKGAVRLVKIDVDRNPDLATQMRVQSVPAVYAFRNGRVVDGFMGAQPESQIKAFVQRLLGGAGGGGVETVLAEAKELVDLGDHARALRVFREVLTEVPDNPVALTGVLRALLALGKREEAERVFAGLSEELRKNTDIASAGTAIEVAREAAQAAGSARRLQKALDADPNDHQARFDLALARFAGGERDEAVELLLDLYRRDRGWNDQAARKQLVKFFEAFGPTDPLTVTSRKRLSSLMFA